MDGALSVRADDSSKHDLFLEPLACSSALANWHLEEADWLNGLGCSCDKERVDGALSVRADDSSKHDLFL